MNHNKLDDFIRQEVEASDFTMQEQDWLRMSAILDEKETKKRPGFWRWFSFSGIIILLGLGTYLLSMQKESDNDYTQSQQEYARNEQSMPTKKETSQTKESEIQKEEHKVDEELINQQNNTQTQSNQNSNQMATSNQNDELIKSETSVPLLENNPAEKKISEYLVKNYITNIYGAKR
ncbi:MAG: hypothetical protein IPI46_02110 [Bacteroidetes bacterium]|nr:hypothetical protein [Bacteroidota bacterium]